MTLRSEMTVQSKIPLLGLNLRKGQPLDPCSPLAHLAFGLLVFWCLQFFFLDFRVRLELLDLLLQFVFVLSFPYLESV